MPADGHPVTKKPPTTWRRAVAIAGLSAVVPYGAAVGYLKLQETELVFRAEFSRARVPGTLPPGAAEVAIPTAGGATLAAVVLRQPDAAKDRWILHLHGNGLAGSCGRRGHTFTVVLGGMHLG